MSHVDSLALSLGKISLGELRGPTSGGRRNILRGVVGVKGIWSGWVRALVSARPGSNWRLGGMAWAVAFPDSGELRSPGQPGAAVPTWFSARAARVQGSFVGSRSLARATPLPRD